MSLKQTKGYKRIIRWLSKGGMKPFDFQLQAWDAYNKGWHGLVNAPTGMGKTYSLFLAVVINWLNNSKQPAGTKLIWVTPLRSLAKDLARVMQEALDGIELKWKVGVRNGDTDTAEKLRQKRQMPEVLIITPESLHLLFAQKSHEALLRSAQCIVIDEWHELLGNKRGVLTELAIAHLRKITPDIRVWAISATIGNLQQALDVVAFGVDQKVIITAEEDKKLEIVSILPDELETLPWAGHMGLKMVNKVVEVINRHRTTLIFTNTRNQSETWYQTLLLADPNLAGVLALHHGSIDFTLRQWIEEALQCGKLKAVVCTSSLDLGVDFKPVDTVIQIGSPKGVARFLQRAGRSGHSPFETSRIYFLPTHSLELMEAAALKEAANMKLIEPRIPMVLCYDVLVQYLMTLAVGNGMQESEAYSTIMNTHAFSSMEKAEWQWAINFIVTGGESLNAYDEYNRVHWVEGAWRAKNRKIAMRHRMQIGVIVSESMLKVRKLGGGYLGMVEEFFASRLLPGEAFVFAGGVWEFVMIKEMTVVVKHSKSKSARAPSWAGGRMPLSANLTQVLRQQFSKALHADEDDEELQKLQPLFALQIDRSYLPKEDELLVEKIVTDEGQHLFVYAFEGRLVHEVLAALMAFRLGQLQPLSFSMAMNDYGFELLSPDVFEVDETMIRKALSPENLLNDLQHSLNAGEMAGRKFRDIATIAGLLFAGYPGQGKTSKNLQSTAGILFKVFEEHDAGNLLLRQAYEEVYAQQLEDARLVKALQRLRESKLIITRPDTFTPLSFPIKVDSLRDAISTEKLEDRIEKMKKAIETW